MNDPFQPSVVVPQTPKKKGVATFVKILLGLVLLLLGFVAGFFFQASGILGDESVENMLLQRQIYEARIDNINLQISDLKAERQLQQATIKNLQQLLAGAEQQKKALKEELGFFRNIMAPEKSGDKITVHRLDISQLADTRYRYQLVVRQQAVKHQAVRGSMVLKVNGIQAGEKKSLQLASELIAATVSQPGKSEATKKLASVVLGFKYFQTINAMFELPKNFQPQQIEVTIHIDKPKQKQFKQLFEWQVNNAD